MKLRAPLFIATAVLALGMAVSPAMAKKKPAMPAAPAAATAAPAAAAAPAKSTIGKPKTALGMKCSKEADAKGLHGAPRKKFREACKKAG